MKKQGKLLFATSLLISCFSLGAISHTMVKANNFNPILAGDELTKLNLINYTNKISLDGEIASFERNGYTFYFNFKNVGREDGKLVVYKGGYIRNITAINGVSAIEVEANNALIIRSGTGDATKVNKIHEVKNALTGTYEVEGDTHFMFVADEDTIINKLQFNFECTYDGLITTTETANNFGWDLKGTGTQQDPYLIETIEDWAVFAGAANNEDHYFEGEYVKLMSDLTLTTTSYSLERFRGTFLGEGHTLTFSNWSFGGQTRGLFHIADYTSAIYDLNTAGSITFTFNGDAHGGPIAGIARGVIQNCTNRATITSTVGKMVAGIAGKLEHNTCFVLNCTNYADVSGSYQVGGITGRVPYISDADKTGPTITGCKNYGNITAHVNGEARVGGIAGYVAACLTVSDCENYGDVTGVKFIGGIVGRLNGVINNCYNEGYISSNKTNTGGINAGGIAGYAAGYAGGACVIKNSTNVGDIEVNGTLQSNDYGGIVGFVDTDGVTIDNCHNEGNVGNNFAISVGGILGTWNSITASSYIRNCTNKGNVTTTRKGGGILGSTSPAKASQYGVVISHCINEGTIKSVYISANPANDPLASGQACIGGIVGYICTELKEPMTGIVSNVYKVTNYLIDMADGELVSTATNYELDGVDTASVYDCVNYGDIIGETGCGGGIAGAVTYNGSYKKAVFKYCYSIEANLWKLDMTSIHVGVSGFGDGWSSGKVKNCHIFGSSGEDPTKFGCSNLGFTYEGRTA